MHIESPLSPTKHRKNIILKIVIFFPLSYVFQFFLIILLLVTKQSKQSHCSHVHTQEGTRHQFMTIFCQEAPYLSQKNSSKNTSSIFYFLFSFQTNFVMTIVCQYDCHATPLDSEAISSASVVLMSGSSLAFNQFAIYYTVTSAN